MIYVEGKNFERLYDRTALNRICSGLAARLNNDYMGKHPLYIGVLTGSYMFMADLMRRIDMNSETTFVRVASYVGDTSGVMRQILGVDRSVEGRHIVLVEDIVDTGHTIDFLVAKLYEMGAETVEVCTLLFKPNKYEGITAIKYYGAAIDNNFVIGYGMDYNEAGRNLPEVWVEKE